MAETLGSLCDKLIVVKLKEGHTDDESKLRSLAEQGKQLSIEINEYLGDAISGKILVEKLVFSPNKIYYQQGNEIIAFTGNVGEMIGRLATVNCKLWHVQERVYTFDQVGPVEKDNVIQSLSNLNLQRNQIIEELDIQFKKAIQYMRR
jgi:hypothetical protein